MISATADLHAIFRHVDVHQRCSDAPQVTVERIDRAIDTTARVMVLHELPQLMSTLKRLEAERDRLLRDGDAIEYAKRLLQHASLH